ncbi:helix-turn-helix transcriptional regulator [Streptomyces sp. NPDC049915]|uniref:helix-turn-helix domain-containing protein n=1 Tax=Streptomyces sp. NPDC049915 TaxID=3155510 RepID=UPI0034383FB3
MREAIKLARGQLADALGVRPSMVGDWEAGADPSGEVRERYACLLTAALATMPFLDSAAVGNAAVAERIQDGNRLLRP